MKEKDDSIVKKINRHYVWKQAWQYLHFDVLFSMLFVVITGLTLDYTYIDNLTIEQIFSAARHFEIGESIRDVLYQVSVSEGVLLYELQIGPFLCASVIFGGMIILAETVSLIKMLLSGNRKVYGYLRPLREMAKQAKMLSQMPISQPITFPNAEISGGQFDVKNLEDVSNRDIMREKSKTLENALHDFRVEKPDEKIHTNDKELRGMENAINELLDRMRAAYAMQNRFVSDASHELRTPIAVIQGYVNMLDRWGKEDEEILEESIQAIQNESNHMQKLVEQLLFLARGDSGRNPIHLKELSLSKLMEEVYEESMMIDEHHHYHFEAENEEEITIIADEDMLKQSARILIDNASKYTETGKSITIRVGRNENGTPYYSVQDEGKGMKEEELTHIFDRFYRTDDVRNSKTGGTGLGLSIAKWIVDQHNGYYSIVSREGLGTRFHVILPQEGMIVT